ncbi:MAG: ATP-binding protein [Methanolobus sp.]
MVSISINVCDTGIGISSENLDILFHPFKQIDSFYNRQYDGTGLGLALVSKFVGKCIMVKLVLKVNPAEEVVLKLLYLLIILSLRTKNSYI